MLLLQAPGALLVMYFLAILNQQDFTTWGPYLVTFIEQLVLIVQCIFYIIKERREKSQNHGLQEIDPLIKN